MMRSLRALLSVLIGLLSGTALILASPAAPMPQASHGAFLTHLASDVTGASFRFEARRFAEPTELNDEETRLPHSGGCVWALPSGTLRVDVEVTSVRWRDVLAGEFSDSVLQAVLAEPFPLASASAVMQVRGIALTALAINGLQPDESGGGVRLCESAEFRLNYVTGAPAAEDRVLSAEFFDLLRGVAANLDEVATAPARHPEPYLIITRPAYLGGALTSFTNWKRARGHTVTLVTTDVTGTTREQIKAYIQNAYDTWEEPPVFVVMVGDVDGLNAMPAWLVPGFYHPWNISDHPYALLDGDDFLPDIFIGRLSVDTGSELLTIVNKCVRYESQPYLPDGDWRRRMLIVGVRGARNQYPTYNSAWPTLQWIGREFLESGYARIDSVPWPPGSAANINQSLNNGVSFVAYRGFGDPSGWAMPNYSLNQIDGLANGGMLPFVTSIVCGGGAFDSDVDPCFGEAWLRAGTPSTPRGAIGFIGPSELDTKTRWNNTIVAGIYEGILHEGVSTLGAALLRGKMELVREFPNYVGIISPDADRSVSFYFDCYNLLGDPGLAMFVGSVRDLSADAPASVALGTPSIDLTVSEGGAPLPDVWGTVRLGDSVVSRSFGDENGRICLTLPQSGASSAIVTLAKPRHETLVDTVLLAQAANAVAAVSVEIIDDGRFGSIGNGDGLFNPGEQVVLSSVLQNLGSNSFPGGVLALFVQDGDVSVVTGVVAVPPLAPGAQSGSLHLSVSVARSAADESTSGLLWTVDPGPFQWETRVEIIGPQLALGAVRTDGAEGNPAPNSNALIALELRNAGRGAMPASSVILRSRDPRLVVIDSVALYPMIDPGSSEYSSTPGFGVQVGPFYPGDWAEIELAATSGGVLQTTAVMLPIGNLADTDPTHPDGYGYRVFQDADTGYAEAPAYAWFEIDPTRGGPGATINIRDTDRGLDTTVTRMLPFSFKFYGVLYDRVSICSNGFVSFGATGESYFRNYQLPAIASPDNMICAFWDDLRLPSDGRVCTYHDQEGGRFVIEWSHLQNMYGTDWEETFELILMDTTCWPTRTGDGDMLVLYQTLNNVDSWDNQATFGIQDRDQGYALSVGYSSTFAPGIGPLRSGQALLYTTGRPTSSAYMSYDGNVIDDDNDGGSHGNSDGLPQNGETIELRIRLLNVGQSPSPSLSGVLQTRDPLITLLDTTMSLPPAAPGATSVSSPVRVVIAEQTPHRHGASFLLTLDEGAVPCVIVPTLVILAPSLSPLPLVIDDDANPPSQGNGNGEINPRETIELLGGASNSGGNRAANVRGVLRRLDNRVTVLDSTSILGDIDVGEEFRATDPFVIRVNDNVRNGTAFTVEVRYSDAAGNVWTQRTSYTVVEPIIESAGLRLADPPPGGNDNQRLTPGETGELYPRVRNTGMGMATGIVVTLATSDPEIQLSDPAVTIGNVQGNSIREATTPVGIHVADDARFPRSALLDVTITGDDNVQVHDVIHILIGDGSFFEDVEAELEGWSIFGDGQIWHAQSRRYQSPTHAFYCGLDGIVEYPPNADEYLRSPGFDFRGGGTLVYSTWYGLRDANDICHVHLQTGPSTHHLLEQFTGNSVGWTEKRYSLAGLPPSDDARVRFWFTSDFNGVGEGWYVDDIIVLDPETAVEAGEGEALPQQFSLEQNYPNPFNDRTSIRYTVPAASRVRIGLYDLNGRRVALLVDAEKSVGTYVVAWQPVSLSTGIYFVRLEADGTQLTRKLIYLK